MKITEARNALALATASLLTESHEVSEALRLSHLKKLSILDTDPEQDYDDIAALAAVLCGAEVAAITFIDETRSWPKAFIGIDVKGHAKREDSFCNVAIQTPLDIMVIEDVRSDARMCHSPWATGTEDSLRFYAGIPLLLDGHAVGAICVLDRHPRSLEEAQKANLEKLARLTMSILAKKAGQPADQPAL